MNMFFSCEVISNFKEFDRPKAFHLSKFCFDNSPIPKIKANQNYSILFL